MPGDKSRTKLNLEHDDVVHFGFERFDGKLVESGLAFAVFFPNSITVGIGRRTNKEARKATAQQAAHINSRTFRGSALYLCWIFLQKH
jgi:hypothetical protein